MNNIKQTENKWLWLFASKQYEHWDLVDFNEGEKIKQYKIKMIDDETRKKLYYDWYNYLLPKWNLKYINHDYNNNCEVQFYKEYIILVANQTIHKWEEITINYWENNIDFIIK